MLTDEDESVSEGESERYRVRHSQQGSDSKPERSEGESEVHRSVLSPDHLIRTTDRSIVTLYDVFLRTVANFGYREFTGYRPWRHGEGRGVYEWLTYDQVFRRVERFGAGLVSFPGRTLRRQERVGILAENRVEWLICDQACFAYSLVSVPLFAVDRHFLRKLLVDSQVAVVVCSRQWTERVIHVASKHCPNLRGVVQMERLEYEEMEAAERAKIALYDFGYLEKRGETQPVEDRRPNPGDVATIVYKVSQSNEPAGCVLTHQNLVASVMALDMTLEREFSEQDVHFSFAPLAYITERTFTLFAVRKGMAIGFSQGVDTKIFEDMRVLKPTFLVGSPGIFENLHRKFKKITQSWGFLYRWFFELARDRRLVELAQQTYASLFWDWILFRRVARVMGGNLRYIIMTNGVMDSAVHDFVRTCFCCPSLYGLLLPETGGFVTLGTPTSANSSVGHPLPCAELKLMPVQELEAIRKHNHSLGDQDSSPANTATTTTTMTTSSLTSDRGAVISTWSTNALGAVGQGELCIRGPNVFAGYLVHCTINYHPAIRTVHTTPRPSSPFLSI